MLRAAICGAGRWGTRLIESVQDNSSKLRFVVAVTRNPSAQQPLTDRFGLGLTTRYADVLDDKSIDAVVLATPHSQHADEIVAAAAAGKHVFVEKPFTLTQASAERAIAACKRAGSTLMVGFNRRYAPAYPELTRRIAAGEIGTMLHVEGHFSGPANYQIEPGNWRSNRTESPAGAMTARGCHVLDGMIHIAGPVAQVFTFSDHRHIEANIDDTTSCLLRFRNGLTGSFATMHASTQFWRIHIFGTKGSLEMRGENKLLFFDPAGKATRYAFEPVDKERVELEAFADAVADKVTFVMPPEEIINNVAVMEAMVASAASGTAREVG
jgi:predicted dehydrogenase